MRPETARADQIIRRFRAFENTLLLDELMHAFIHAGVLDLRLGVARHHGIDVDVVVTELARHYPGHADDRRLRCDIVHGPRRALRHRAGGYVDDPPLAGFAHRRRGGAGTKVRASDVHMEHFVPLVEGDVVELASRNGREHCRIVDQHIDPAVFVEGRRNVNAGVNWGHGAGVRRDHLLMPDTVLPVVPGVHWRNPRCFV